MTINQGAKRNRRSWSFQAGDNYVRQRIALGIGFVAEAAAHDPVVALFSFGPWGSLSVALLYLLFRRGKNSLAFALGLGAATAFIALLAVARGELSRTSEVLRHAFFILGMLILVLPGSLSRRGNPHSGRCSVGSSVSLRQCSG